MHVGFVSAPLTCTTGYGKVAREVCFGLADMGYEVTNIGGRGSSITVGERFNVSTEKGNCVRLLSAWGQTGDHATLEHYIRRYQIDAIISLYDAYVFTFGKPTKPWAAQFPIDAALNKKWCNYVVNADYVVAMSKFGEKELLKFFPEFMVKYIPHGVDTSIFKPRSENERMAIRQKWRIPEDAFVILCVAANWGERKCLPQLMITFKRFLKTHPKAVLYLYTNFRAGFPMGYNLMDFADLLGLSDQILGPAFNPMLDSIEDTALAELYAACDVLVNPSLGEGFGLPIIEAQACGTPVIGTNCSSMIELIQGHGWLIETVPISMWEDLPVWVPLLTRFPVPNLNSLLKCLSDAYRSPEKRRIYGIESLKFAVQYSWDKIMPKWKELIKEMTEPHDA